MPILQLSHEDVFPRECVEYDFYHVDNEKNILNRLLVPVHDDFWARIELPCIFLIRDDFDEIRTNFL